MKKIISIFFIFMFCFTTISYSSQDIKTGFLVLAPDRGFVGNEETANLFIKFQKEYPSSLAFVGRNYNGMGSEYSQYIQDALGKLIEKKVANIVVLPLFLSDSDPILKKVKANLSAHIDKKKLSGVLLYLTAILPLKFF